MLFLSLLLALVSSDGTQADDFAVDSARSLFAVVTHRGGAAARLAHNHLITASQFEASLTFEEGNLGSLKLALEVPVDSLVVDDEFVRRRWAPRIAELGIEDKLGSPGPRDRRKIRKTMLGDGQLAANDYSAITATSRKVAESEIDWCPHGSLEADVEIQIRGETRNVQFDICVDTTKEGSIAIEAVGTSSFTDFGIRPYSGVLGTVKNKDEIDFYAYIIADKE